MSRLRKFLYISKTDAAKKRRITQLSSQSRSHSMLQLLALTNTKTQALIDKNTLYKSMRENFSVESCQQSLHRIINNSLYLMYHFVFIKPVFSYQQSLLACSVKLVFSRDKEVISLLEITPEFSVGSTMTTE